MILLDIIDSEDKSSQLKNCIRNNYRHLRKWAKRTCTDCFRIYDREIKECPVAIDVYAGRFCVHYFAKKEKELSKKLIESVETTLISLFKIEPSNIYWRTRIRREKRQQYEKIAESKEFFIVKEYGVKFKVNLVDYLDTGIFLDHRETRRLVAAAAKDKKVLNLFAYTCSFSVHAALGGAILTKSVDMSNTYTAWGKDNFELNHLPSNNHEVVREDCLKFLNDELRTNRKYDVIIIDPPTISRSKKMKEMFDIQQDYILLLSKGLNLLSENGVIFFSTNSRKFVFDQVSFSSTTIEEISHKTLPIDFHDPKIHRCWKLQRTK